MFSNKLALITGGNSGIGKACALQFAEAGAHVLIAARSAERSQTVIDLIAKKGGQAEYIFCDLRKTDSVTTMFDNIKNKFGSLDIAINNAGIEGASFTRMVDYPDDVWEDVLNVNLKSLWFCVKRELQLMLPQQSGTIVNVASLAGIKASLTAGVAYTASKFGVVGITRSAALEVAKDGVRINAICPGMVRTQMAEDVLGDELEIIGSKNPMGRICEPEEVANLVTWLCSPKASYINGTIIPVDGGYAA